MDETSPVFENFLNNMSRLSGGKRKVAASKFLQREGAPTVEGNAKKIRIITRILKARRVNIGQNIMDIKETVVSILGTLEAQEKFEKEKFLDMQRMYEDERRKDREKKLERKPVRDFLVDRAKKISSPIVSFLERILRFIVTLFFGRAIIKLLNFLSDPKNERIVNLIGKFFDSKFGAITLGVLAFSTAAVALLGTLATLTTALLGSSVVSGLGNLLPNLGNLKFLKNIFGKKVPVTTSKGVVFDSRSSIGDFFKNFKGIFKNIKFREDGGNLNKDDISIVGEGGPEIFVPKKSGTIIPNNQIGNFIRRRFNRGSLNPFGQRQIRSGAAGRVRVPVFSGRPYQGPKMFGSGPGFATTDISTARSFTNPNLKGLPGTGGRINPLGTLDRGTLPQRFIDKFGSRSVLGQQQIKLGKKAFQKTFGTKVVQKSGQGMLNLLKAGKIAPLLGTALDFAFPESLADGSLEAAQRMNIPGTPVKRSNNQFSSIDMRDVFNKLKDQFNENDSETFNETFSMSLPLGDPRVYEIMGVDGEL